MLPGNNSGLVREALRRRPWWGKVPDEPILETAGVPQEKGKRGSVTAVPTALLTFNLW